MNKLLDHKRRMIKKRKNLEDEKGKELKRKTP